ncbi:hypothetical protein BCT90_01500 [Vibrio lentus]|uniref:hypothetical protein n=1 Tax=Vibrio lentus TaxID=136468 RepID=UPI000C8606C6|nr:hypothetical protein [Vibrio lentus]PMK84189.1 hypothetical protein BCT90_01500 [Vibrio lentus]
MSDFLGSIGQAIGLAKRLREISKNVGNAEFSNILADLNIELAESKLAMADLMEQISQLKMENQQLKSEIEYKENQHKNVTYLDAFVFENDSEDRPVGRPHCRTCYKNYGQFHGFAKKGMTPLAECTNCGIDVKLTDAQIVMTPVLFERLLKEKPHLFTI